jgi:hypothetical protein
MRAIGLVCVLAVSGLNIGSAQAVDLRPGRYEVTMEMGPVGMTEPADKDVQCITSEDLKDLPKMALQGEFAELCKVNDYKASRSKLTFTAVCEGSLTMKVDMTFAPESFTGVMTTLDKGRTVMTTKASAKRLGDCK